jgi:hypothetical protein
MVNLSACVMLPPENSGLLSHFFKLRAAALPEGPISDQLLSPSEAPPQLKTFSPRMTRHGGQAANKR